MDKQLVQVLDQFHSEEIVFIPNPGNAGDSFINAATYQLFSRLKIRYRVSEPSGIYPRSVVIYGGGGNLNGDYDNAISLIKNNYKVAKALVVLPHTISAFSDTLANLGSTCYLFCREERSYDYVSRAVTAAHVYLSHDLALGADLKRIQLAAIKADERTPFKLNWQRLRLELIAWRHILRSGVRFDSLSAFRTDVEKTEHCIPSDNFDASAIFATRDQSPDACFQTSAILMRFLNRYERVKTNRLHICIMSLMLGKRVEFYPNSYYKNEAIYLHSLSHQFPLLEWKGPPVSPTA